MLNPDMPTNAAHWAKCALCGRTTWVSTERNWCTEPGTEPGFHNNIPAQGCKFRYLANHKDGETPATNADRLFRRLRKA